MADVGNNLELFLWNIFTFFLCKYVNVSWTEMSKQSFKRQTLYTLSYTFVYAKYQNSRLYWSYITGYDVLLTLWNITGSTGFVSCLISLIFCTNIPLPVKYLEMLKCFWLETPIFSHISRNDVKKSPFWALFVPFNNNSS